MGRIRIIAPEPWPKELTSFDAYLEAKSLPLSTRRMRSYQLRSFAVHVGKPPYDVELDDILGYLSNAAWAANSKAAVRSALRGFYRWAAKTGRIRRNPAKSVEAIRTPRGHPRPAAEGAIERALAKAPAREALMIRLAAELGLRCCEVAKVHPRDLRRTVWVNKKGKKKIRWSLVVLGKGDKTREVPIVGASLATEIRGHSGYLFPGQIDGHVSAAYVSRLVSRALPAGVTAHMLRHRFASKAYSGSKDIRAVQELLGHASVATTQVYTAINAHDLRIAARSAA